jgi:hypothetical protein
MTLRAAALLLTLLSLTASNAYASTKHAADMVTPDLLTADLVTDPDADPLMVSTSQFAPANVSPGKRMPALLDTTLDTALYTSVVAWRTLDYFSTEQCLRSAHCRESQLPAWLVQSKPTFIAFEAGSAAGEIVASRWLHARGHGRMARTLDMVSVTCGTWSVAHNYAIQSR